MREARHVLPVSTFTSLAAKFQKEDKEGRRKERRQIANVDLLREMFWKSESLEELQATYKEKLTGLVKEGAKAVNLKRGEELLKEGEGILMPIQEKITTAAKQASEELLKEGEGILMPIQ